MKYRTEHMGGTLDISKVNEKGGTVVTCTVPMERVKKEESFKKNRVRI